MTMFLKVFIILYIDTLLCVVSTLTSICATKCFCFSLFCICVNFPHIFGFHLENYFIVSGAILLFFLTLFDVLLEPDCWQVYLSWNNQNYLAE